MKDTNKFLVRKWKEKDKLNLLDRIKSRYMQLMKLRMNVAIVDP